MRNVSEQFFQAMRLWSQRTASSEESLRQLLVVNLGRYDEQDDMESNLNSVEQRVEELVDHIHLSERFLIKALIREIEAVLADQFADALKGEQARGVRRVRAIKARLIEQATPQERDSPAFRQRLRRYEDFERSIFPTPEKVAQHQLFLETWREVTSPLISSENMEEETARE